MSAAAVAAKIALTVVGDKRLRMIALSIIVGVVGGLVLLIVMLFSLLTMPFDALTGAFSDDEVAWVTDARSQYGFDQYVSDESYLEEAGLDYSGVTFTDGATEVVYYNQLDARWADTAYGLTGTIGRSGCGPTALAIAVSSLTGTAVDPVQMSRWSYENGYYLEGSGSYHALIPDGATHFGVASEGATAADAQKIVDALAGGKLVIAIMGKGHFTSSGHFIVLRGVTAEGKILVADPASVNRSQQEWELSIVLNEARGNAGAGGPFWILG
jgi:hypothetical protein